jgi:hypothetical protein
MSFPTRRSTCQSTPYRGGGPLDNSKCQVDHNALGNAHAYNKAQVIRALDKVPYDALAAGQYAALAQSAKNWDEVRQLTYNALTSSNHGPTARKQPSGGIQCSQRPCCLY